MKFLTLIGRLFCGGVKNDVTSGRKFRKLLKALRYNAAIFFLIVKQRVIVRYMGAKHRRC